VVSLKVIFSGTEDMDGLAPRAPHFLSPRGVSRGVPRAYVPREDIPRRHPKRREGPSALACLGKTSQGVVPSEVRDASLSLGKTKRGCSAGQKKGWLARQKKGRSAGQRGVARQDKRRVARQGKVGAI
jgi:hypothetical protein